MQADAGRKRWGRRRAAGRARRRWCARAALGLAGALLATGAQAVPVTLEDASALLTVDPVAAEGLSAWTVNGVQHVRTQRLFVRVGDAGPEVPVDTLALDASLASDTDADGRHDTLFLRYLDPAERFRLEIRFVLDGSPFAPVQAGAASDLATQITLVNTGVSVLDVSLFQYTAVDLFGSFVDDEATFGPPGGANTATVTDSSGLATYQSVFTRAPDGVEAALFGATLGRLLDGTATTLDGSLSASGDVTLAASWDAMLAPGGALLLSQDQQVLVLPIPEPATALMLGLGLAGLALHRRQETRA